MKSITLIDLDCLLDTRLGTLSTLNEDAVRDLLLTNKLSLMEDLKAILTVGAILVVPFIAAPKAMFAIVLYIIIYMAFRWRNF